MALQGRFRGTSCAQIPLQPGRPLCKRPWRLNVFAARTEARRGRKYEHHKLEAAHCEAGADLAATEATAAEYLRLARRCLSMIPRSRHPLG